MATENFKKAAFEECKNISEITGQSAHKIFNDLPNFGGKGHLYQLQTTTDNWTESTLSHNDMVAASAGWFHFEGEKYYFVTQD